MKPRFVNALVAVTKLIRPGDGCSGRSFLKVLLLGVLLSAGLAAGPADASLEIITTGTIISGSETGGLFGLPTATTSLVGASYTLIVGYNKLGPNFFSTGDGSFAQDNETPGATGYVTAIVNGHTLSTALTNSLGSSLIADLFDFVASNQGYNGATTGAFVNVLQELSCSSTCVPYANLAANFKYILGPNDFGTDLYTFQGAGFPAAGTPTANFIGTEASFAFVPEPGSFVLLAIGLLALGMVVRRGRA